MSKQLRLDVEEEIIVDLFAGGGGMSVAIEQALGRSPDIAINHSDDALSMHRMNHPQTRHFIADVWEVCPRGATQGRPVGLLHLSPDCTHHSQAAGGQPRNRKVRALSWVGYRWAGQVAPRVITLENVKQILQWGPLVAKRCKDTGRVITLDMVRCEKTGKMVNRVAEPGERVPVREQYLVPDKKRAGQTWKRFIRALEDLGYEVDHWPMISADHGGNTTRERLFMVARRDGLPIVRPEQTNFKGHGLGRSGWRPAAECIDWTIPCQSIFERKKPLADATMRRIARGIQRYVLDAGDPFIVPIAHYNGREPVHDINDPMRTITANPKGGAFALCAPTLIQAAHGEGKPGGVKRWGSGARDITAPLGTVTASGGHAVATAFLEQANTGMVGHDAREPVSTIVGKGSTQRLVTAHLAHLRGNCDARDVGDPLQTISAGGQHHGLVTAFLSRQFGASVGHAAEAPLGTITAGGMGKSALVECQLSSSDESGALRVAAFLMRYYSTGGQWADLRDPMHTINTRDRLALVTVTIQGTPYVIVDIGLRMLVPRELFRAQGFPPDYIIDRGHDGRAFSKSKQVRMCGNSVSPPPAKALIAANCSDLAITKTQYKVTA